LICVRKGDFQTKVNDACGERHDQRQPLDPRTEPSAAFGLRSRQTPLHRKLA